MTQAEIKAAKKAGQTLAQLAVAKGKTVDGLTAALTTAGTASIDAAAAAGTITAAQATTLKTALPARVTALINATGGAGACAGKGTSAARSSSFAVRRR